jgi:hypothetical protein
LQALFSRLENRTACRVNPSLAIAQQLSKERSVPLWLTEARGHATLAQ